ncbi:MAG: 2-oxoglutarate and iron-dependent oxygenase domain-containing protein [Pseudomonadota bacterium]
MIPILDWSDATNDGADFTQSLSRAVRESGFFLLRGHPIEQSLIDQVFAQTDALFDQPLADKRKMALLRNPHNRGWTGIGEENLDDSSDEMDRKEAFNIGLDLSADDPRVQRGEPFRGVNTWPKLPNFRATMLRYFEQTLDLGRALHIHFARDLGLPDAYFAPYLTEPLATLRLLSYPPGTGAKGEIGAGAHTDYGSITLLMTDGEAGLQVQPRGQDWVDVPHVPGAFVINIGDCLMRWTNDIYVSTPHRVLPPARRRRSLAFFLDPNPEAVISALPGTGAAKYPTVTSAAYLQSRLSATYKDMAPA